MAFAIKLIDVFISISTFIHLKELLAQTPHHIARLLAEHINMILLTDMRYYMQEFVTDSIDDTCVLALTYGKNASPLGKVGIRETSVCTLFG